MGFGCAIIGAWLATQLLVGVIYALCLAIGNRHAKFDQDAFTKSGLVLSLTTVVGAPVVIGLSLLFARLRAPMRAREYLGLHWPRLKTVIVGSITFVALIIAADVILGAFENSDETPVMVQFYRSAKIVPLFWLAIVVVGPASEEFFFRGFMLEGLRWSRLGAAGAVVSTATVWAAIHVQYDFAGMAYIFSVGLLLGWIRLRTKSLPLCIVLHGLMNLMATLQMAYRYGSD
jgi:membrane protease YdiL (CAAX protease family)